MSDDLRRLFLDAYSMAARQGREDWRRMNIGVLKNRLLNLTRGEFNEQRFGKKRFRDLVADFPDLLKLDESTVPASVELIGEPTTAPTREAPIQRKRIRPDLWQAVVDYRSGKQYVWDAVAGVAREAKQGEEQDLLPTLTIPELAEWRANFAAKIAESVAPAERARVDEWQTKGLGASALPAHLRGAWYQELKANIEERLEQWFRNRESRPKEISAPSSQVGLEASDLDALRSFITQCIGLMTKDELMRIQLPATVLLRSERSRSPSTDG